VKFMKFKKMNLVLISTFFLVFLCAIYPNLAIIQPKTSQSTGIYVPSGLIALWSGTLATIPEGWILCDGTEFTPNTNGRFIYGTNGIEDPGATGGSIDHYHNYTTVPLHDHGVTSVTTCVHNHRYQSTTGDVSVLQGNQQWVAIEATTGTAQDSALHSHSMSQTGVVLGDTSEIDSLLPPYYKLAIIKKITTDSIIPAGIIMMWSGLIEDIPQGWVVCDGTQNTPDLEGRFILGVTDEDPGAVGGNLTHSHTYTDIPQHSHTTATGGASHNHNAKCGTCLVTNLAGFWNAGIAHESETTDTSYTHSHSMDAVGQGFCTTEESEHLPPYTSVAFLMNLQNSIGIPTGIICLFGGELANVPIGWNQCDGTGTSPNLSEKFLRSYSVVNPIGSSGGSLSHTHGYTEIPVHTHSISNHDMTHDHFIYEIYQGLLLWGEGSKLVYSHPTDWTYTANASPEHFHDILPAGLINPETHSNSNLPPYIKLIYIQNTSPITTINWISPVADSTILFPRAPTVQFDFEYNLVGLGTDITLSFTNGTNEHDAGSVWGMDNVFIPYMDGEVDATFHLFEGETELTTATRSFLFINNRDPTVTLTNPNGGETLSGEFEITWTGNDADGDQLYYTLEYNVEDTGWVNIASDLTGTSYDWNTSTASDSDSVKLRVIAEDAFGGQSIDESNAIFSIDNEAGNGGIEPKIPGYSVAILVSLIVISSLLITWKRRK